MQQSFNLIDENWVPVLRQDLSVETVSLRTLFHESDSIVDISCDLPTMRFSVFRIALAILRRSVDDLMHDDPENYWEELWNAPTLPLDEIDAYLDSVHDRFDLLDPEKPFLQTPGLHTKKHTWHGLEKIIIDSPGSGALYSRQDPNQPLPYEEAALWLIHANAFDYSGIKTGAVGDPRVKQGKTKPMQIGWSGWLGCTIINGATLKETLLLNYAVQPEADLEKDLPIWEEPPLSAAQRPDAQAHGQLSLITWPQRRILLHNDGKAIDGVLVTNGDPVDYVNQITNETMTPWRFSRPQSRKAKHPVFMPKALGTEDYLWKGLQSFMPQSKNGKAVIESVSLKDNIPAVEPPETVCRVADRIGSILPNDFTMRLDVTSVVYGTQNASYSNIVEDKLTFPGLLASVEGRDLRDIADTGVKRAKSAIDILAQFAANIARAETDSNDAPGHARDRAREVGYSLIDGEFKQWLSRLSIDAEQAEQQLQQWTDHVRDLILREGQKLARNASPAAWHGRKKDDTVYTVGRAETWFRNSIYKELPTSTSTKKGE